MKIDILHIAKLARLKMTQDEAQKFESELEDIIRMVEQLPDLTGAADAIDISSPMVLREDVIKPSCKREDILRNAPQTQAGCIVVPKVVE